MRLVKLSVQRFQCIESAELELGPGLNVLYGPNDIGKSSLAWAVRAVLLLQHNSTQHERFVSWHGGGEPPRVALTFVDAANRYWRVSKTFGGAAGRSSLETSKDGRTFSRDVDGRQVDEKVRKMLGWGVNAPGGKTSTRGIPDAFLIQVLLADQDNVRKILFESSLGDDPDESGRARLTEALGALAQDPLFKKILDNAQAQTDKAFTATGRKKKTATSPFVELDARIKDLEREHEELEAKVRETTLAEARIRELLAKRDDLDRELRDNHSALATMEKRLEVQRQRATLQEQIEIHEAVIRGADELRRNIETTQQALVAMQKETDAVAVRARDAATRVAELEGARDQARTRLDGLTHDDTDADRQRSQLEETQRTAQESLHAAQREAERAAAALKLARETSATFKEAVDAATTATAAATLAEQASSAASDEEKRARVVVADAQQALRDATSDDKARARELRRTELHNRRLTRQAERAEHSAVLARIAEINDAVAKATAAEAAHKTLVGDAEAAKQTVAADEAKLEAVDLARRSLGAQERYGQLRQARAALAAATQALAESQQHRARAAELRAADTALRAKVRASIPTSETIAGLRTLRENVRIADAQLAVGLSVAIRPKRSIALRSGTDGAPEVSSTVAEPLTLTARRQVALHIDDLVDVEILAGEETARAKAAALRDRWESEGAGVLREHRLDTIEELEKLRSETDANLRAADEHRRDAEAAEQRAEQVAASAAGATDLSTRIAELERDLGAIDTAAVETALERLGSGWVTAIKKSLAESEAQRQRSVVALDNSRPKLARLDAQLEVQTRAVEAARLHASGLKTGMPDMEAMGARATAALETIDRDLVVIEQNLAIATEGTSDEEAKARGAVDRAVKALEKAELALAERNRLAGEARDAAIKATTRAEGVRTRARELDTGGVWAAALADGARLPVDHWSLASSEAEQARSDAKAAVEKAVERLEEATKQRADSIKQARDSFDKAEASARGARATADELATTIQSKKDEANALRIKLGEMKAEVAGANLESAREAIAKLKAQLDGLGPPGEAVDVSDLEHQRWSVERLEGGLREAEQELAKARGALEQVGGAVVRERQQEIVQAISQARAREHEIAIEYDAWRMLVETLRETESAQGTNLGKALAAPVSARFRELTGGRYGRLEMGPHLDSAGIQVAGNLRELDTLSAGTQDQLATLLRICVAEQLRSSIVLDDHLSQSDPDKVGWFNNVLRNAAKQIQIVFITCRPSEVLNQVELPSGTDSVKVAAAGLLHAIDLTRVIKRFAAAPAGAVEQG
jgi:chromosome segregation ATPase